MMTHDGFGAIAAAIEQAFATQCGRLFEVLCFGIATDDARAEARFAAGLRAAWTARAIARATATKIIPPSLTESPHADQS